MNRIKPIDNTIEFVYHNKMNWITKNIIITESR